MAHRELTPADYIAMLRRRWVLILVLTVIGPPLAYGVSQFLPSRYKSQTLVLVQQPSVSKDLVKPVDTTDVGQDSQACGNKITSRTRLEPVIHQFGLYAADVNKASMEGLVAQLQAAIEVTPVQAMAETGADGLPGFTVTVTLDNALTRAASMHSGHFHVHRRKSKTSSTAFGGHNTFLSEQLADAKANLDAQDAKLAAFKSHYIGSLPDEEQTNLNILTGLTSQLDAATQTACAGSAGQELR